ncbi:MAG: DNA restriction-modification system adenine-specific methylase subunit [Candidatus Desulfovibrio kirbyi]|uniref:DNA restriction-modification system adenine-specific methylase subunit n=1 Tax=Candidatus Desulfovibrio kirbyi TaxID=2696086 RepID=A0A6L2R764_9BACT|nr:MAG: DNA restriction-modification system adenine-specific methylase subunit [Candidatus Desulfovibrio kirbyi]
MAAHGTYKKKLIEVALPLEAINAESVREKSIRHGHPSTLHLWWARRPLAATRAVIFSSLVDDPSSHPEQFPSEEAQAVERNMLFALIEELVKWENSNNQDVLDKAKAEILKSTDGNPPALLDPFAGGGAIPLEAQRLGLEAHASNLNPVAVMINKAMIEIPPKFAGLSPVNPEARKNKRMDKNWTGASGLAEDVRYYGEWMKQEAFKRIGHLYPKVQLTQEKARIHGGSESTVIAWIWARTVKCPNPACGCEMPLASSFVLSKKTGKEAYIQPEIDMADKKIRYTVKTGKGNVPEPPKTSRGAKFKCIMCGESTTPDYIKDEAMSGRMGAQLMAVVAEGHNGRLYVSPDDIHFAVANIPKPQGYPTATLPDDPRNFCTVNYGLNTYDKLFTHRQLTALTTFSSLVQEAQKKAQADALAAGMSNNPTPLANGGTGASAYGQAVGVYLAFVVDKLADLGNSLNVWEPIAQCPRHLFSRQAIPMVWDFAEGNPLGKSSGSWHVLLNNLMHSFSSGLFEFTREQAGIVRQFDAQSDNGLRNIMISTDPPYYDNISYADLSDFFYVWLRQSLKNTYPDIFRTMLVPKVEELVATPSRFDGSVEKARDFFESGMLSTFRQVFTYAREDIPVTIYYAFKQSESEEDGDQQRTASTGWETMLSAITQAGFSITGTWPMRTEMGSRAIAQGTNALASSIVLVCRKRPVDAPTCTRREFINTLKRDLRPALKNLQRSNIAPVDLAQSAIGPGMGVYSRFAKVLEADGAPMSVRSALQIINQELDLYFTEQDGELDRDSRFCVDLYSQYAFNDLKFGEADVLARAKNTSVEKLVGRGILYAQKGVVRLLERSELPEKMPPGEDCIWLLAQQLTKAMEIGGVVASAKIAVFLFGSGAEHAKALAYRLFTIAERKGWAAEAYAYNSLVIAWPEIQAKVNELHRAQPVQGKLV